MMKKKLLNVFILFLLPLCATHAITANEDTLLKVLREELAADMAELQQQEQKPYWMSFFVEDSHIASVIATFGSLGNSGQEHTRTFMPQIRIGSPEIDNYKSKRGFDNAEPCIYIHLFVSNNTCSVWHLCQAYEE